jgi:GT2 family glycosyltransferase
VSRLDVTAVLVGDHDDTALDACVESLVAEGVRGVLVIVGARRSPVGSLAQRGCQLVPVGVDLGYAAGANRGIAACPPGDHVLVCASGVTLHHGALAVLAGDLDERRAWALVSPVVIAPEGSVAAGARGISPLCLLARRSALEELGGFNESLAEGAAAQDLYRRALGAGWGAGTDPAAGATMSGSAAERLTA